MLVITVPALTKSCVETRAVDSVPRRTLAAKVDGITERLAVEWKRADQEGVRRSAIHQDFGVRLVRIEERQIMGAEAAAKNSGKAGCVLGAWTEDDTVTGVRRDTRPHLRRELRQVLMCHREPDTKAACLGEHVAQIHR